MRGKRIVVLAGSLVLAASTVGAAQAVTRQHAAGARSQLNFTLDEMAILKGQTTIKNGRIVFFARNAGTVEHELVVVRGTEPLAVKKFKADEGGRWIGEIEGLSPGKSGKVTLNLKPGKYLLLCNIVGHYPLGMRRVLVVT